MILSLVAALVQAQAPIAAMPADERPVRVWIDAPSPLIRGLPIRVYVRTATSGNLIVLHRRTDGRIEPLFPASPKAPAWVHAGQYEIRSPGDRPAFVLAEPDGGGMILAALTSGPIWFDEFAHDASWNPDALVASWDGADAESALTDIVQRMLGDGAFNYDILSYQVRPAMYAQQPQAVPAPQSQDTAASAPQQELQLPTPQTCIDCTFIGTQIVDAPLFITTGRGFRHRRFEDRQPPCPKLTICGAPPEQLIARTMLPRLGPALGTPGVPPRGPGGRTFTTPRHAGTPASVEARPRATTTAAQPLVPGRPARGVAGEHPPVATAASRSALALRYVRVRPMATAAASDAPEPTVAAVTAPSVGTIVTPASLRLRSGVMAYRLPRIEQGGTQTFAQPRTSAGTPAQPRAFAGTFSFPSTASRGGAASSTVLRSRGSRH